MTKVTVYGHGGFDPAKPNNNIIEEYELPDEEPVIESPRDSALAKLTALGLTEEEVQALLGQ